MNEECVECGKELAIYELYVYYGVTITEVLCFECYEKRMLKEQDELQ